MLLPNQLSFQSTHPTLSHHVMLRQFELQELQLHLGYINNIGYILSDAGVILTSAAFLI